MDKLAAMAVFAKVAEAKGFWAAAARLGMSSAGIALLPGYTPRGSFGSAVYAVYLPTRYLSPKIRASVDFIVERFGPEPHWDAATPAAAAKHQGRR